MYHDTGILFNSIKQYGGTSAALSWLEEVDDDDVVCGGVCSANGGSQLIATPTSTSLMVHIYIGIHSTFFGRILRTDR
jgi:hypothetical protein